MYSKNLEEIVQEALEEFKAQEISVIDVRSRAGFTDYMIICTGTSTRHVQAIAENVIVKAKHAGFTPIGTEGEQEGEWVLVDLGDVIVHIMLADTRKFYSLEKLWKL